MKNILQEFWESISVSGFPIFYLVVIVLFEKSAPYFAGLKWVVIFLLLEVVCAMIKLVFPTHRPIQMKRDTIFQKYTASGFPSVHSARIAALATLCFLTFPKDTFLISLFLLLAVLVGYSRVYLKKHFLKDVVVGWLLGIGIVYFGNI